MRVLLIGLGSIARKHIIALRNIDLNVMVYAFRSSYSTLEVEGVTNIYDLDSVGALNIDFIIISNPTFKHKETIESLLFLNLPLFIEKPLFDSLEGKELLSSINQKKIITYVACNLRFLDCLKFTKEAIKSKIINEVNIYCGSYLPEWRPNQNFRETYSSNREMGGGVHIDLIHELDYSFWLFGQPQKVRLSTSSVSSLKIAAIDYANYMLQFENFNINIVLNYYRRDAKRTLEVVCEDGTFYINLLENEVFWNGSLIFKSKQKIIDTYTEQMKFFTGSILTQNHTFNTVNEAYEILKICFAKD
jgi:predicted dehydrogenase